MIVKCAFCGPLPLADIEALGDGAWTKHEAERHCEHGFPLPCERNDGPDGLGEESMPTPALNVLNAGCSGASDG